MTTLVPTLPPSREGWGETNWLTRSNGTLEARLARHAGYLTALAELGRYAAVAGEPQMLIARLIERARQALEASQLALLGLSGDGQSLVRLAMSGEDDGSVPVRVPAHAASAFGRMLVGTGPGLVPGRGAALVALALPGHPGLLCVNHRERTLTTEDADFLAAVAAILAQTLSRLDTTDRLRRSNRQLMARLETQSHRLDLLIAERQESQRARLAAEQANAAKTRFLAAASHDLRQPLQAAIMFSFALANQPAAERQRSIIRNLQQALDSLQEMLNLLLDISRLDAGIVESNPCAFSLASVLEPLCEEFRVSCQRKGLELRCVPSQAVIRSDPCLFERILRNLLSNALHYTSHGRVLIGCRRAGDLLRIQVWDTGVGIPADLLQVIFEEFYQVGNPTHDRGTGLGLGLAIVQRLAALLGHAVDVRSQPGKGSMFEVTLPLAGTESPRRHRHCVTTLAPPVVRQPGALVVVIDDDAPVLESVRLLLELFNYRVIATGDDDAAVTALRQQGETPALIITDYRLGSGCTGAEVIDRLRTLVTASLPGILLTGDTAPERLGEALAADLLLLHKPITPRTLLEAIDELLCPTAAPLPARESQGAQVRAPDLKPVT